MSEKNTLKKEIKSVDTKSSKSKKQVKAKSNSRLSDSKFSLSTLRDNPKAKHNSKRLGRGIGSGKGKTSGKGHKGQKARAGATRGYFEGGQMPLYRRFPKRGFISRILPYKTIDFSNIELALKKNVLSATKTISEVELQKAGWFNPAKHRGVKLLNRGEIETKFGLKISKASKQAIVNLEKFGGKIELFSNVSKGMIKAKAAKKEATKEATKEEPKSSQS